MPTLVISLVPSVRIRTLTCLRTSCRSTIIGNQISENSKTQAINIRWRQKSHIFTGRGAPDYFRNFAPIRQPDDPFNESLFVTPGSHDQISTFMAPNPRFRRSYARLPPMWKHDVLSRGGYAPYLCRKSAVCPDRGDAGHRPDYR
jgi:hypothetical protein